MLDIKLLLDGWERYFGTLDYPEAWCLNRWRTKFSAKELDYAFQVAKAAVERGSIKDASNDGVAAYVSAVLRNQRQQQDEVLIAINQRKQVRSGGVA